MANAYRSFAEQALHYFIRDHEKTPSPPINSPANWMGSGIQERETEWLELLSKDDLIEISDAVDQAHAQNIGMEALSRETFALPRLSERIASWRDEIKSGRGFVVVRGFPLEEWGGEKAAYAYWGLGHHLGAPGAQNPQGELLGHVVDYGEEADNPIVRRYRTTGNIDFHCDAADAVGLLCLQTAKSGGQSRIVSSVAVFNEISRRRPDLINRLFEPFFLDKRGEERPGDTGYVELPPCCWSANAGLQTFYHSEYFRSADRLDGVTIDKAASELLDLYDQICATPEFHLDMWLQRGDMQFISNHTTLHARTGYEDWPERNRKRHLLRLWLSL